MTRNLLEIKIFDGENSWGRFSEIALKDGECTHGSTHTQTNTNTHIHTRARTSESVVFTHACSQNYDMALYPRSQSYIHNNIPPHNVSIGTCLRALGGTRHHTLRELRVHAV